MHRSQFDYESYYRQQAGGSIDAYTSLRYLPTQRGNGFFGRLIRGTVWPLIQKILPYAKQKAVEGVGNLVSQLSSGSSFADASRQTLKKTGREIIGDVAGNLQERLQDGSGVRRKRAKRRKTVRKTVRKKQRSKRAKRGNKSHTRSVKRSVLFP